MFSLERAASSIQNWISIWHSLTQSRITAESLGCPGWESWVSLRTHTLNWLWPPPLSYEPHATTFGEPKGFGFLCIILCLHLSYSNIDVWAGVLHDKLFFQLLLHLHTGCFFTGCLLSILQCLSSISGSRLGVTIPGGSSQLVGTVGTVVSETWSSRQQMACLAWTLVPDKSKPKQLASHKALVQWSSQQM